MACGDAAKLQPLYISLSAYVRLCPSFNFWARYFNSSVSPPAPLQKGDKALPPAPLQKRGEWLDLKA